MDTLQNSSTTEQTHAIELKASTFTMSVLHIKSAHIDAIVQDIQAKIAQAPQFFVGLPLVLELSAIAHQAFHLADIQRALKKAHLIIVGIIRSTSTINDQAKALQLAILT